MPHPRLSVSSSMALGLVAVIALTLLTSWKDLPVNIPHYEITMDRAYYVKIAQGDLAHVIKPFIKRVLHPKPAAFLSRWAHLKLEQSFFVISLISLAVLIGSLIVIILKKSSFLLFLTVFLLFSPYLNLIFSDIYMHDLFFSAFLALFFVCLAFGRTCPAVLLLFPLFLIREATVLLCLLLIFFSLARRRYGLSLAVIAVTGAAMTASSHFSAMGGTNRHELGELTFMALKVVYNFLSNVLGVNLWVTGYTNCVPEHPWAVPAWFPSGHIRQFALCDFNILQPLHTLYRYLTTFGILPFFVFALGFKHRKILWRSGEFWLVLAFIYGLVSYFLGPSLGPGGFRLIGYGWPAFWIAGPVLLSRGLEAGRKEVVLLVFCHVALLWEGWLIEQFRLSSVWLYSSVNVIALVLYLAGWKLSRRIGWKQVLNSPHEAAS